MTAYRPRQVDQLDGSRFAGSNCTAASAAVALDRETLGRKTSTGAIIRNWTYDTVGGLRQSQVVDALERAYGVELDLDLGVATADAFKRLDAGHGMMLAGQSSATRGTKWSASETFGGNHQWFLNERRANSQVFGGREHLVYDPLADGRRDGIAQSPFWIPEPLVLLFASRLNVSANPDTNYFPLGPGKLYAVFTHDTEPHLVLRYGATVIKPPNRKTINVPKGERANVRSGPGRKYRLLNTRADGGTFVAFQVTTKGEKLGRSSRWFGNIDGDRWIHRSGF